MSDEEEFESLRQSLLDFATPAEWDTYYEKMAAYALSDDPETRFHAVERLTMAVFRAEPTRMPMRMSWDARDFDAMLARARWLRSVIESVAERHDDVKPVFIDHMKYHGDDEPFGPAVVAWFKDWLAAETDGELRDALRGGIILHEPAEAEKLWALLDDPSDYVRACAAKMLGEICDEDNAKDWLARIGEKDIARPGVAGPFWSGCNYELEESIDPTEWMLDILQRRKGPEPVYLPFNGIDFHLHELCDSSPETVELMLRLGHKELALMTATERSGVVEGMEPLLQRLGEDSDPEIAKRAIWHLAYHYRTLHTRAAEFGVTGDAQWDARAIRFTVPLGERTFTIIYPREPDAALSDEDAWGLIDRFMAPEQRGDLMPHDLSFDGVAEPYRIGESLLYKFPCAYIEIEGDVDARRWTRIQFITASDATDS